MSTQIFGFIFAMWVLILVGGGLMVLVVGPISFSGDGVIDPIINSGSVWRTHALFLIGEFFYSKDQKKKSKEFFDLVISSEKLNPELQKRAQQRLNRDLSD